MIANKAPFQRENMDLGALFTKTEKCSVTEKKTAITSLLHCDEQSPSINYGNNERANNGNRGWGWGSGQHTKGGLIK